MKSFLLNVKQGSLSALTLCALHDPILLTLSSPAGYYKGTLVYNFVKLGFYKINRIGYKVIIVFFVN